jgi:hypothetical protein
MYPKAKYVEPLLFYGSVCLSAFLIFLSSYNPSLDGPAHLYNARILNYLFSGNAFIGKFYAINKIPIPNLTDHFLLAVFNLGFSSPISLKILLTICIVGFALAFRSTIALIRPENKGLSSFAIPLAHSFLYHVGFYNFCLSLVFMLWAIYYHQKHFTSSSVIPKVNKYLVMLLFIVLTYFTNGLAFIILGMALTIAEIKCIIQIQSQGKIALLRIFSFSLLWLPCVICLVVFNTQIPTMNANPYHTLGIKEHIEWVYNVRPLLVYGSNEMIFTRIFFGIIMLLFVSSVYVKVKHKMYPIQINDILFLVMSIVMLLCYFVIPDSASVGMMSVRLCFYFFLFFILWVVLQKNFNFIRWGSIIGVYTVYWVLFFGRHYSVIRQMDTVVNEIISAGKYINSNSIVLPVECTDNWQMMHFIDYTGITKPVINPANYEPFVGWFPVIYNKKNMPNMFLGDEVKFPNLLWWQNPVANSKAEIDYIFVLGDLNKVMIQSEYEELKTNIENRCKVVYASSDSLIHLYSVNHKL